MSNGDIAMLLVLAACFVSFCLGAVWAATGKEG